MNARVVVLIFVATCVFGSVGCATRRDDATTGADGMSVPLVSARVGTIEETVEVQGHVGAPSGNSAKLAFVEPGILKSVNVHVGETVSAGEVLAVLDLAPLAAPLGQARAEARAATAAYAGGTVAAAATRGANARLAAALANLKALRGGGPAANGNRIEAGAAAREAELKLQAGRAIVKRQQQLFSAGVIARKDLEASQLEEVMAAADLRTARAKLALASSRDASALAQANADVVTARSDVAAAAPQNTVLEAQAELARARFDAARVAYDNGSVVAPADGVVLAIVKHAGEAVDATSPVIEIGSHVNGAITLTAPSNVAAEIASGDQARIWVSGGTAKASRAIITAVLPLIDSTTQLVTLVATGTLRGAVAGSAVNATIAIGHVRGVVIPQSAIVEDPETGKTVVFIRRAPGRDGGPAFEMRTVATGATDASNSLVVAGLRPGERIAAQGGYALLAPVGGD